MASFKINVQVLAAAAGCPDNNTCPHVLDLGDPEYLHLIVTDETDPDVVGHHDVSSKIGPGERLVRFPRAVGLPEVAPR